MAVMNQAAGGSAVKMLLRPREQDLVEGLCGVAAHSIEGLSMRAILFIRDCSDTCIVVSCKPAKVVVEGCRRCCVRVSKGVLSADGVVVIAGLTNGYADYTVTKEECAADTHTYTIMHAAPGLGQSSLGA